MTKEELLQKLTLVAMDHADITTLDKPIIGTHSLAPCLGILLYDEEKKKRRKRGLGKSLIMSIRANRVRTVNGRKRNCEHFAVALRIMQISTWNNYARSKRKTKK